MSLRAIVDAMGTLAIDAVLVDSRLVHQFPITGSAAVRAQWSDSSIPWGKALGK